MMPTKNQAFPGRGFILALGVNAVWINASEVFRYFVFVMPMMREALPGVENVAPMNVPIFLVWGIWDTVLLVFSTLMTTLWLAVFGSHVRQAIAAGAAIWGGVFCIFWIAMLNMNIATPAVAGIALLFALIEMVVAALITRWALRKSSDDGLATA